MKTFLKIFAAILALAVIAGIVFAARRADSEQQYSDPEKQELSELKRERVELLAEIEEREQKLERQHIGVGHMMLMFISPDEQIFTEVYPDSKGLPAGIVISPSAMPGDEGFLSWDQLRELLDAGWELCLGLGDADAVSDWHRQMQEAFTESGVDLPSTVYLTDREYDDSLGSELKALGYTIVIHHGEAGGISNIKVEDGFWLPGAVGWYCEGSSSMPKSIAANGGSLVFTLGVAGGIGDERYDHARYVALIERLLYFEAQYGMKTATPSAAFDYYTELSKLGEIEDEELSRLKELLDECERKISKLE